MERSRAIDFILQIPHSLHLNLQNLCLSYVDGQHDLSNILSQEILEILILENLNHISMWSEPNTNSFQFMVFAYDHT